MRFESRIAAIRFGCGLSPRIPAPTSAREMIARLAGPDEIAARFPVPAFGVWVAHDMARRKARKLRRKARSEAQDEAARKAIGKINRAVNAEAARALGHVLLRRALTQDGLRERLAAFWADHFTAFQPNGPMRFAHVSYVEEAIRPHLAGRFADMLSAVATHPLMLRYLDQARSAGPASRAARRNPKIGGLNENLAREMLELHTLGVDGPYTQRDVRELAELLTGLSYGRNMEFEFRPSLTEPGAEIVLGRSYGGGEPRLEDILAALDDLARHPATARHVARKLAVHFVSDTPDEGLVAAMEAAFAETDGDLSAVYDAMLDHPAAWAPEPRNAKRPIDFVTSALRALDIGPRHLPLDRHKGMRAMFATPLELMGQPWGHPTGPDGFPEADPDWITPQRLAARVNWAMTVPARLLRDLPDPRAFVDIALGGAVPPAVRFAAAAAETRAEGIGVVLAAPAFQRM